MFHGQPYCDACGYEGPDFMWMFHHGWGFRALVQDRETLELRTVEVPDNEVFHRRGDESEGERHFEQELYVAAVIARQLRAGERHVPPEEFAPFTSEGEERRATELPCPRCRATLLWQDTGIS